MTSPRLALVSGSLNLGGSTTFLLNLAGEFVRREKPVCVFSMDAPGPLAGDFQQSRIPVSTQNIRRHIFEDRLHSTLVRLRDYAPTHLIGCLGPESFETLRYTPPGIPRLGMIQSDDPNVYRALGAYAPWLDGVIGVSRQITGNCAQHPALASIPAHCLPYGVPFPQLSAVQSSRLSGPSSLRILYLGRLVQEQKRVRLFPEIQRRLIENGTRFSWTIAGDGPECAGLETAMPSGDGHQIRFTGKIDYRQVPALLAEHDVFLLASDYEGLPLSLLEAMGHGLVPVVSDLASGIPEVVDASCGVLVPPDHTAAYADAISGLDRDRSRLASLSGAARQRVEKEYSIATMTDRWLELLESLPPTPANWPGHFHIQAPLEVENPFLFSPPVRPLRRLLKTLNAAIPRQPNLGDGQTKPARQTPPHTADT